MSAKLGAVLTLAIVLGDLRQAILLPWDSVSLTCHLEIGWGRPRILLQSCRLNPARQGQAG